jgi:hypothetical protein
MDSLELTKHDPLDRPLPNRIWRLVHGFLVTMLVFAIPTAVCFLIGARSANVKGAQSGWLLAGFICLPFALAMLFCAAIVSYSAWRAGQTLEKLSRGDYLVNWTYVPEDWLPYCEQQGKGIRAIGWALVIIAGSTALLLAIIAVCLPNAQRAAPAEGAGGAVLFSLLVIWIFRALGRAKAARVAADARAVIGRDSLYCGGDMQMWRAAGNGLVGAAVVGPAKPGGLARLEFLIGIGGAAKKVVGATDMAMLAVGRASYVSSYRVVQYVPIPRGEEETAAQICAIVLRDEKKTKAIPVPAAATIPEESPMTQTEVPPTASVETVPTPQALPTPRGHKHPWWRVTGTLFGTGVIFFCVTVIDGMRTGGKPTGIATFFGVIGMLLAALSIITLLIAIATSLRHSMHHK